MTTHYFAYGSNLNTQDWHRWCRERGFPVGLLRPLFPAFLPDRGLAFTVHSRTREGGVLDVGPCKGHLVEGMVFEVADGGWEALDRKEGAPSFYRSLETEALTLDGRAHAVRTYEVLPQLRQTFVCPSEAYLKVVRDGYKEFSISSRHLDTAAKCKGTDSGLANLFVYGTLMRRESRFPALASQVKVALLAEVPGRLVDLGDYPGMLSDPSGQGWVHGDFLKLSKLGILDDLDRIEGFPGFSRPGGLYRRRILEVGMKDGRVRPAWVYLYQGVDGNLIPSGDWRSHRGQGEAFVARLSQGHVLGRESKVLDGLTSRWTQSVPEAAEGANVQTWIAGALKDGSLSERQLAQASGMWRAGV